MLVGASLNYHSESKMNRFERHVFPKHEQMQSCLEFVAVVFGHEHFFSCRRLGVSSEEFKFCKSKSLDDFEGINTPHKKRGFNMSMRFF